IAFTSVPSLSATLCSRIGPLYPAERAASSTPGASPAGRWVTTIAGAEETIFCPIAPYSTLAGGNRSDSLVNPSAEDAAAVWPHGATPPALSIVTHNILPLEGSTPTASWGETPPATPKTLPVENANSAAGGSVVLIALTEDMAGMPVRLAIS